MVLLQAMRSTLGALKPIFLSIGHRISLTTAMKVVKMTCNYRVPEPIRQVIFTVLCAKVWFDSLLSFLGVWKTLDF